MQRRRFLKVGLAGALGASGLGFTVLSADEARAQRSGVAPIAIASLRGARAVARVYPGRNANELVMLVRSGRQDSWRLLTLPEGAAAALQARLQEGQMAVRLEQGDRQVDLEASLRRTGGSVAFSLRGGREVIEGIATAPAEPGPTTRLGFFGALVAIIAIMAGLAVVGMITGNPMRLKFRCGGMGCEVDWTIGREEPGAPAGTPPANGFMADPTCDLLPPMLC
mgnify:CR=1 FL=1